MKPMQILIAMLAAGGLPTMESESRAALADAQTLTAEEQLHAAYFTTYAVAAEDGFFAAGDAERTLSFWVNSLSSKLVIKRPAKVSPTLYRIDIRDYGWSRSSWAKVTSRDPYQQPGPAGVLCVRLDWFIVETSDATRSDAYYRLLYKNTVPRNLKEFQAAWKIRVEDVRAIGLETGAVIEGDDSIVAIHNRILARSPTITGAYWQTFDTDNPIKQSDYLETLTGAKFQAQEHIAHSVNGLQVYFLSNANGTRQDEAPENIAIDRFSDPRRVTVRTARSCVICHSMFGDDGYHIPVNAIREMYQAGITLNVKTKSLQEFVERFHLSEELEKRNALGQIEVGQKLLNDRRQYAKAVHDCNGLTPKANAEKFQALLNEYEKSVTPEQAAREFGLTVEEFQRRVGGAVFLDVAGNDANANPVRLARGLNVAREKYEATTYSKLHAVLGAGK